MPFIPDTISLIAFLSIVVPVSFFLTLKKPLRSLVDIAMAAAALSAIVYILLANVIHGAAPLAIFALGGAFFTYLPLAYSIALVGRLLLGRTLYLFRGGPGTD